MLQLWAKHGGLFVVLMCLNGFNMFILYSEVPKNNHWSPSASQAFFSSIPVQYVFKLSF